MNLASLGDPSGQSDSSPAFNIASAEGGILYAPKGYYDFRSPLIIDKPVTIIGDGSNIWEDASTATTFSTTNRTMDMFKVRAHGVTFQDINFGRVGGSNAADDGNAVLVGDVPRTSTQGWLGTNFTRCRFIGHCRGIWFINAASWTLNAVDISACYPLHIENRANFDAGDAAIINSTLMAMPGVQSSASIIYTSGGGLKISNSKLLGGEFGLWLQFSNPSGATIGPQLSNVSIENATGSAIKVQGPGRCDGLTITGCHLDGHCPLVDIASVRQLNITGNVFGTDGQQGIPIIRIGANTPEFQVSGNVITGNLWEGGNALAGVLVDANAGPGLVGGNKISGVEYNVLNYGNVMVPNNGQ